MKLLSPPGLAGIAVLEVEPRERADVVAALQTVSGKPCRALAGGAPIRAALMIDDQLVDDVLVVCRVNDQLELHVHGSPAVLDQLDQRFGVVVKSADSPAERLLREALSVEQFELAIEQRSCDFEAGMMELRSLPQAEQGAALLAAHERSRIARALIEPQRVVLVGQQNAGKSSIFNQLLFRERAVTGATPGLTRDPIAEVTTLSGYPYEIVDTAGEGEVASRLDAEAIASGRSWRQGALLVLIIDGAVGPSGSDRELAQCSQLVVSSKSDLDQAPWPADMARDVELSTVLSSAELVRSQLGRLLALERDLPRAGAVGGFAALDERQLQLLIAFDADCSGGPSPA